MVWLPKKLGLKKVGILALNVPQSQTCAEGLQKSFDKFGDAEVVFSDENLPFGAVDYSAQVAQMIEEDVDFVVTCIDGNGGATLAQEMRRQGLDAVQLLPNAYNQNLVEEFAEVLEGYYVMTPFAPFETRPKPQGLKLYDRWMKRSGGDKNENSYVGWMNADLFVEGLKAAGPDFTQPKVVDAINAMTDYTAKGILAGTDWTTAHETDLECYAMSKIVDGKFRPALGKKNKPFVCLPPDLEKIPKNPEVR
jgi:ABC-type branched-subunit amino acid transport system substrate-binding protein